MVTVLANMSKIYVFNKHYITQLWCTNIAGFKVSNHLYWPVWYRNLQPVSLLIFPLHDACGKTAMRILLLYNKLTPTKKYACSAKRAYEFLRLVKKHHLVYAQNKHRLSDSFRVTDRRESVRKPGSYLMLPRDRKSTPTQAARHAISRSTKVWHKPRDIYTVEESYAWLTGLVIWYRMELGGRNNRK